MRRLGARAFGSIFFCAFVAGAQPAPPESALRIEVTNCAEGFAGRLPSIVKLEIDVLLRERGPTRAPPEKIAVRCDEERAHLEVTLDGARRASTIDLHQLTAEHRARAVALAAAELVHAMAVEPPAAEAPPNAAAIPPMAPASKDRPAPDVLRRRSSLQPTFLLGGLAEWRGNPTMVLIGGRLAFQYPLGEIVAPELSLDATFGGVQSASAHVAAQNVSAAAHLYFGTTTGSVRWDIAPGARFGWVHLGGQPEARSGLEGHTVTAVWGGPELRARVAYRASQLRPALVALQVGAGLVALPVRGLLDGSEPIYAVEGFWMSVCVEVGLGF
jgi:hypothetical protein